MRNQDTSGIAFHDNVEATIQCDTLVEIFPRDREESGVHENKILSIPQKAGC
jgi:hypothetical protein